MQRERLADSHDPEDFQWLANRAPRNRQPANEYQALMEAPFGEEPEESIEETHRLREALAHAVDTLPPSDRWLFEVLFYARLSLRFVARILDVPKTTLARRRDALLARLRLRLGNEPAVQERLNQ